MISIDVLLGDDKLKKMAQAASVLNMGCEFSSTNRRTPKKSEFKYSEDGNTTTYVRMYEMMKHTRRQHGFNLSTETHAADDESKGLSTVKEDKQSLSGMVNKR